jgi:hypothetical protein
MVILSISIACLFLIISGISKAIFDKINFHFHESVFKNMNQYFWNPTFSYLNKYKGQNPGNGPRFFGSTTFFVFTTDAWHLFQMIHGISIAIAFFLIGMQSNVLFFIIGYILNKCVFELFFKYILSRK